MEARLTDQETEPMNVHLPVELTDAVRKVAKREGRTLKGQYAVIIREWLAANAKKKGAGQS